jgi:class 3 adenylate cyclase
MSETGGRESGAAGAAYAKGPDAKAPPSPTRMDASDTMTLRAPALDPAVLARTLALFRRRHMNTLASLFLLDLATTGVLTLVSGRWTAFVAALALSALVFGLAGAAGARLLTRALAREWGDPTPHLKRLPARSAALAAGLTLAYCLAAFQLGVFFPEEAALERLPSATKAVASLWFGAVYVALYAFFAYYAVADRCATLRARLAPYTRDSEPDARGRFVNRLVPVFLFLAIVPASLLALDLGLFREVRMAQGLTIEQTILLDGIAALLAIAISLWFVSRSLTRPVRLLAEAQQRLEAGDLRAGAAVVSDDELGRLTAAFNRMVRGLRERERLRDAFDRFTGTHQVADAVMRERAVPAVAREATILFTDIEGFATISEGLAPGAVFDILNEYVAVVGSVVREHGGTVNNYLGDSVMGLFNLPDEQDGHARRAVEAALDIQRRLAKRRAAGQFAPRTRVGIATGPVHAGVIGDAGRSAYTAYGHAVNLASRLEQANKQHGTLILASERTRELAGDAAPMRCVGEVTLKGFAAPCAMYAVDAG